jgi:predicted RNase H-like HicB family nuclease
MEFIIVLEAQENGGYSVFVPALAGCISQGETREEAIANIKEAILLYLEPSAPENINNGSERLTVQL